MKMCDVYDIVNYKSLLIKKEHLLSRSWEWAADYQSHREISRKREILINPLSLRRKKERSQ
jgi:hypothetical protein